MSAGEKDEAHISPAGQALGRRIAGVVVREGSTIVTRNGHTTEVFSEPWGLPVDAVRHVIHVSLRPAAVSAWHLHREQTDQITAIDGMLRVALYDPREDSPTHGQVDVLHLSPMRPTVLVVPPGIWHGIQNLLPSAFSAFLNLFDRPYVHGDPDEWRLPEHNDVIPYRFPPA